MTTDITEMGIMPMLSAVLGGDIPENSGSTEKQEGRKNVRGEVTSPVARRLFTADTLMAHHITRLIAEHESLHARGEGLPGHDCEVFQARLSRLLNRRGLLHDLLWQAITEEHPLVASLNEPVICDGWMLVDGDEELIDDVSSVDKTNFVYNYVGEVTSIINGSPGSTTDASNNLIPVGEGEEVIGILEDTRVRQLWPLIHKVSAEYEKQIMGTIAGNGPFDHNARRRIGLLASHLFKLAEISKSLFWCGVADAIPAANVTSIGIRDSWKVVKYTPTLPTTRFVTLYIPVGL